MVVVSGKSSGEEGTKKKRGDEEIRGKLKGKGMEWNGVQSREGESNPGRKVHKNGSKHPLQTEI